MSMMTVNDFRLLRQVRDLLARAETAAKDGRQIEVGMHLRSASTLLTERIAKHLRGEDEAVRQ